MAEVSGVGAIIEGIRARIGQIEEQLRQHRELSDELERLRGALERLEGGVSARVSSRGGVARPARPERDPAEGRWGRAHPSVATAVSVALEGSGIPRCAGPS